MEFNPPMWCKSYYRTRAGGGAVSGTPLETYFSFKIPKQTGVVLETHFWENSVWLMFGVRTTISVSYWRESLDFPEDVIFSETGTP